ncbi:hypothetical protein MSPP1_000640 [Malassezia sp. CBS 17886]|nr:hypothetical protein MSPP1_000640 [Malassezia sp. CBS 17886]
MTPRRARPCDAELVRTLFGVEGAELPGKELPHVFRAYEAAAGAPLLDEAHATQVLAFAAENGAVHVAYDAFMGMVRGLEADTEPAGGGAEPATEPAGDRVPTDTESAGGGASASANAAGTTTTPTTRTSQGRRRQRECAVEARAKHTSADSIAASPERKPRLAAADRTHTRAVLPARGHEPGAPPSPSARTPDGRAALVRKLASLHGAWERLQDDHTRALASRDAHVEQVRTLQRLVHDLQRNASASQTHEALLTARLEKVEAAERQGTQRSAAQQTTIHALRAQIQDHTVASVRWDAQEAARNAELDSLRASCGAYAEAAADLQRTCDAQREAIAHLESTVETLESALDAAERLQSEYDAFRGIHEELERELVSLREAVDLNVEMDGGALTDWKEEVPRETRIEAETEAHSAIAQSPARVRGGSTDARHGSGADMAGDRVPPRGTTEFLTAPACPPAEEKPTADKAMSPAPNDGLPTAPHTTALLQSLPHPPLLTPPRLLSLALRAQTLALVLAGIWLGIWVYYLALHISPHPLAHHALAQQWGDANRLDDPFGIPDALPAGALRRGVLGALS